MTNVPPWSYSALTSFETCPKRYFHIKVAKDIVDAPGEAALWGSLVHKHLEDRLALGTSLPVSIEKYESLIAPIIRNSGKLLVEQQMAVDQELNPVVWESDTAWCRGIVDVGLISTGGRLALLLDWKTGRRKFESDQLKLFAALAFAHFPQLQTVQTGFVWLKENIVDNQMFTRQDIAAIWAGFAPRIERLHRAYKTTDFKPKPSGLCRNFCPVPRTMCSFSGRT